MKSYILKNSLGLEVEFSEFGGRIFSVRLPSKVGYTDIVVDTPLSSEYINQDEYMGAICGRYANRIAGGQFSIEGKDYFLTKNDGENHLHGGKIGFCNVIWKVKEIEKNEFESAFELLYISKNGEEGYPGNLEVSVIYALNSKNEFHVRFKAKTDQSTIVNLTCHPYFNLKGKGSVLDHNLYLNANHFCPVDEANIPTGEINKVRRTPFDFTHPKKVSDIFMANEFGGLDHNFVLNESGQSLKLAAVLSHPDNNRKLEIHTTQPCVQVYTSQHFNSELKGKDGTSLKPQDAIAIEPQNYPDAPNHKNFGSPILNPGDEYAQEIVYKFSF